MRKIRFDITCLRKWRSMSSVTSTSAITPSLSGRTASIPSGVLPSMRLASRPTLMIRFVPLSTATTDGSLSTTPSPLTQTSVFAVPRSTPMSLVGTNRFELNQLEIGGNCHHEPWRLRFRVLAAGLCGVT